MNHRSPHQPAFAIVSLCSIFLLTNSTRPLQGSSQSFLSMGYETKQTPQEETKTPTTIETKAKTTSTEVETIPQAPTLPEETVEKKEAVKKETKKLAEEKEEAKKQPPVTRNLILLFDNGNDTNPILSTLASGLLSQNAFIFINDTLWKLFIRTQAELFAKDYASIDLKNAVKGKSCADIFFDPKDWDVYAIEGDDATLKTKDTFYLFVPHSYKKMLIETFPKEAKSTQTKQKETVVSDDEKVGLDVTENKNIQLVNKPQTIDSSSVSSNENYRQGTIVVDALAKVFRHSDKYSWNVFCHGHGDKGDEKEGHIINISIPSFQALIKFFDYKVRTNFFYYQTCFAGGEHLTTPFQTKAIPFSLTYPIAAGALLYTPTWSINSQFFDSSTQLPAPSDLQFKSPIENLSTTQFLSGFNFNAFFDGLESFAQGTSRSIDLIHALNAVGNFLTPNLKEVKYITNVPQIRFPGTTWFQVMRLTQDLPIVHLTRTKIIARMYDAFSHNQPWELDCTGKKIILLQNHDIAVPIMIDEQTKLVPLIHTIPFFQQRPLIIDDQKMPKLFAFTTPLIANGSILTILSKVWFQSQNMKLDNTIFLINDLIGGNDFYTKPDEIFHGQVLNLERVMVCLNVENPPFMLSKNAIFFCYHNTLYCFDMDKTEDQLESLDNNAMKQYQEIYAQCVNHCRDESIMQLIERHKKIYQESCKTIVNAAPKIIATKMQEQEDASRKLLTQFPITSPLHQLLIIDCFEKNNFYSYPIIIELATKGILSSDKQIFETSIGYMKGLFKKHLGFTEALSVIIYHLSKTNDSNTKQAISALFQNLITYKNGLIAFYYQLPIINKKQPEAARALLDIIAKQVENNQIMEAKEKAFQLFAKRAKKGIRFVGDIDVAIEAVNTKDYEHDLWKAAIPIFRTVLSHHDGLNAFYGCLFKLISEDDAVAHELEEIAAAHFTQKEIIKAKKEAALKEIPKAQALVKSKENKFEGLYLFKALVMNNEGLDEATKAVADCTVSDKPEVNDDNIKTWYASIMLCTELVKKNKAFTEATYVAWHSQDIKWTHELAIGILPYYIAKIINLFRALFAQHVDEAYEKASALATKQIISEHEEMRNLALDLFKELFVKNKGFTEAQNIISTINKDEKLSYAREDAKQLQESLDAAKQKALEKTKEEEKTEVKTSKEEVKKETVKEKEES